MLGLGSHLSPKPANAQGRHLRRRSFLSHMILGRCSVGGLDEFVTAGVGFRAV